MFIFFVVDIESSHPIKLHSVLARHINRWLMSLSLSQAFVGLIFCIRVSGLPAVGADV